MGGFPGLPFFGVGPRGFPLGNEEYTLLDGIVSKQDADGESDWASVDSVIEHSADTLPGNSGGPIITEDGQIVAVTELPSPGDFRVDQLLTSEFFGLNSTVDPDVERLFDWVTREHGIPELVVYNPSARVREQAEQSYALLQESKSQVALSEEPPAAAAMLAQAERMPNRAGGGARRRGQSGSVITTGTVSPTRT